LEYGKWELQIPANPDGSCPIAHMSEVKVIMKNCWLKVIEKKSILNKDYVFDHLDFYIL
jgi:1,4-alpha-glucan branching enzyme